MAADWVTFLAVFWEAAKALPPRALLRPRGMFLPQRPGRAAVSETFWGKSWEAARLRVETVARRRRVRVLQAEAASAIFWGRSWEAARLRVEMVARRRRVKVLQAEVASAIFWGRSWEAVRLRAGMVAHRQCGRALRAEAASATSWDRSWVVVVASRKPMLLRISWPVSRGRFGSDDQESYRA